MARRPRKTAKSAAVSDETDVTRTNPIVGIGASAGGVSALLRLFEALPDEVGAAFVVIVHLAPDARSELAEIIGGRTTMPVHQVRGVVPLHKDCIYVIPPDRQLRITDNEVSAEPFTERRGQRTPIDLFFESLAAQHGDGFAVILTGAGSDGSVGVKAAKEAGAIVLVQDPEEAEYPSMPRSAIATGAADFVLPVREIAARLPDLVRNKASVAAHEPSYIEQDEQLRSILANLRARTGHDFNHYKRSTVLRRVLRRLQVTGKERLGDYLALLRDDADEAQALLGDLLISVTSFFRDPKAFDVLAQKAIPDLFEHKRQGEALRVWVPGCATGEEVYSIAILLLEEAARHDIRPELQVFGSDLDAQALAFAREGRYPRAIEADVSEDRLRRFFSRDGQHYRVKRDLRPSSK